MEEDTNSGKNVVPMTATGGLLTRAEFQKLADVLPEVEWFADIRNIRTRRAYQIDIREFMGFIGISRPEEFRIVVRAHVLAYRKWLEARTVGGTWEKKRGDRPLAGATIRRKLSALSSLFEHLCECNAVLHNPVDGVTRPKVESYEGKTPALGDHQARELLNAPNKETLKGKRDAALLSTLLYHGLRREEACSLKVKDVTQRRGVLHLRVHGKGDKLRYIPLHPGTAESITEYVEAAGYSADPSSPLFKTIRNNITMKKDEAMTTDGMYKVVMWYARKIGIGNIEGLGVHSLRATAATNALEHEADISKVQDWLGHSNISTTRMYDRRKHRPEDSPTFKVAY